MSYDIKLPMDLLVLQYAMTGCIWYRSSIISVIIVTISVFISHALVLAAEISFVFNNFSEIDISFSNISI